MISRTSILYRNTRLASKLTGSKIHTGPRQWFESLFSAPIPKGFGKFYPPGSGGSSSGAGKTAGNLHNLPKQLEKED